VIVPSLIRSTASSTTKTGTRNHSRGITGLPNRSLISMSSRAGSKTRWITFSNFVRLTAGTPGHGQAAGVLSNLIEGKTIHCLRVGEGNQPFEKQESLMCEKGHGGV